MWRIGVAVLVWSGVAWGFDPIVDNIDYNSKYSIVAIEHKRKCLKNDTLTPQDDGGLWTTIYYWVSFKPADKTSVPPPITDRDFILHKFNNQSGFTMNENELQAESVASYYATSLLTGTDEQNKIYKKGIWARYQELTKRIEAIPFTVGGCASEITEIVNFPPNHALQFIVIPRQQ